MTTIRQLSPLVWMLICAACGMVRAAGTEDKLDAREGDDIKLECRFSPLSPMAEPLTYYWIRTTPLLLHDNVAIGNVPLQSNYRVEYSPEDGRYDLLISNTTYERDNGKFECRIKAGGSGRVVHAQSYSLVVLIPPKAPIVAPGPHVNAQEAHQIDLTCSTVGGSPEPTIKWYRDGSYPLEANVTNGKSRSEPSVSSISLMPTKDDDGAIYKCVVWNRAMAEGEQLESTIELSVNYYPRVEVGPENPLRVETDATAMMTCKVDAKPKANNIRWTRNGKFVSNSYTHTIQKVSIEDAGKYTCTADNGLGKTGEGEVYLDVLYPPTVTVKSTSYTTEEGGNVEIRCDVNSNPEPISIEWTMENNPNFKQNGDTLVLQRVTADMAGTYTCRAVNVILTSSGKRTEKSGSASVAVLVRHKPGRAVITPSRPVTQEGASVTLSCAASPPGWPQASIRWFRDTSPADSKPAVLATGPTYTIASAHLGSEGLYFCQVTNELGHGDIASITLEVQQPPRFQNKLQPHAIKRATDTDFSVTCSALGKPRPNVRWLKDGAEIKPEANLYEVKTEVAESRNAVYTVQSTLRFKGNARPNTNELIPEDRGIYSCTFENEVKKVDSTMHLRIEHEPIAIQQKHKVAYDLSETAEINCRILSHPKPEFQWFFGSNPSPIQPTGDGNYEIDTTTDNNDIYLSVLKVKNVKSSSYGDYYCKVKNSLGTIRPQIRLQPKGAPESPTSLASVKVGPSFVTLGWEPGFDGGLSNTKYFVRYRRISGVPTESSPIGQQCSSERARASDWMEYDCGRMNPCNVTRLEQHDSYSFKVKAVNTKGQSNYSNEISVTTKVDAIPPPEQLTFDPSTHTVAFSVEATCLALVAVAEALVTGRGSLGWQVVDTVSLALSGSTSTYQEAQIEYSLSNKVGRQSARSFAEPSLDELNPRLRMKLCLRVSQDLCSEYTEAEIGPSYIKEASALTTPTLIAIVVSCLVFLLFLTLLFIFCRCKKNASGKEAAKEYEMDSMRPSMVTPQNQAPPPYYPSTGMENKALEHSMELALMEESKSAVYGTQPQYGYHHHPHQNVTNPDWANMGYMENGYANSNNGGSVNSQDSLWQMKMAAGNNGMPPPPHQMMDRQSNYGYDPLTHGGYGTIDEYAPYPHLTAAPLPDQYNRTSQNPSRQEYCSDPYASVHKPKKRMDQHIESPYHEVSGLPSAYGGVGEGPSPGEDKPHMSLGYDETLESGYSTPNSRARRVIREIIV